MMLKLQLSIVLCVSFMQVNGRLQTYDTIQFQALSVEYNHIHGDDDKNSLRNFMTEKGYTVRAKITGYRACDYMFVKKGFNEDIKLPNIHTKNGKVPSVE